ncbi:MAG: Ig domain-containing protein [Clostridia bacterium]|nr:Ig domain-containing protein [Clostridia bacterium]
MTESTETQYTYNADHTYLKIEPIPAPVVTVDSVTVDPATLTLTEGDSLTLTATVAPDNAANKTVIWASSDPAVATVDANGKVTAVAAGTATITATTEDGGKTATCAVTVSHSYTAQTKSAEALVTAGNCRDCAVYYYSCSACGQVENNDGHTFNGDKVPGTHVGGTRIEGDSEPDHKTQTAGSTGNTICNGCDTTLTPAQPIQPDAHAPANVWSNDETCHWKECTVEGCGIVIDGSKATHSSDKAENKATCQKAAVCDVCGVSYGTVAAHDWNTSAWENDATGHWHKCNTAGCTEQGAFEAHTPDHQGGATEEYAITCTVCRFEIEAQLVHTHVFDKEVAEDQYKISGATCTEPAKYHKSCRCGEKGSEAFTFGLALGHTEGAVWEKDATGHRHICTVAGCDAVIESSEAEHTPDRAEATEVYGVKCSVCGYVITPALGHTHAYGTDWKSDKNTHWNECACGDNVNSAPHKDENTDGKCDVCTYNVGVPTPPDVPGNPQTGENNMLWVWITLLFVSGFGFVTTIFYSKKRYFTK